MNTANDNVVPELKEAVEIAMVTIGALGSTGDEDKDEAVLLAKIREMMFDVKLVEKGQRQLFLKRVNEELKANYSMNKVRKAAPVEAVAKETTASKAAGLLSVDELHGSVTLTNPPAPSDSAEANEAGFLSDVQEALADAGLDKVTLDISLTNETAVADVAPSAAPAIESTQSTLETITMKTETTAQATTASNTTGADKNTVAFNEFLVKLDVAGYKTDESRASLYANFITGHPNLKAVSDSLPKDPSATADAQFFGFVSASEEANSAFEVFLIAQAQLGSDVKNSPKDRSRFDMRGERDDGVRGSWMAVGGAVIGAALEIGHKGSLTVGSAVGAVAGITAAFFAGEYVDTKVEGAFGRQVAAGSVGLVLGSLGSGLGRLTQTHVAPEADLPVLVIGSRSTAPAQTSSLPLGDLSAFGRC